MFEKFGDFIFIVKDPDPDQHCPNFEDPDPHTINSDPQPWGGGKGTLHSLLSRIA